MELGSRLKDALRVATSQTLATAARLDGAARDTGDRLLHRAGLATPADLRRLTARLAALQKAADTIR